MPSSKDIKRETSLVVKTSNELAMVPLQNFDSIEINWFYAMCYLLQGRGEDRVEVDFDDFRQMTGYSRRGNEALLKKLNETSVKFSRITLTEKKKYGFKIIVPFIGFEADYKKRTFSFEAHRDFVSALNDLDGSPTKRYTKTDLIALRSLNSTYSKHCLKMLFVYRNLGAWNVLLDEMRYFLSIPTSYRTSDVNKLLASIKREFEEAEIFESFDIIPRYEEERKKSKGRKKMIGYTFVFRFKEGVSGASYGMDEPRKEEEKSVPCPKCGKPLFIIKRKDGKGRFYGHKDGWDKNAPCHFTLSEDRVVEAADAEVYEAEKGSDKKAGVSRGDLERYYRYIREQEAEAEIARREHIRSNEPEIWKAYEKYVLKSKEMIDQMTTLAISEESRERKKKIKEERENALKQLKKTLRERGYEEDYLELRYRCPECRDTGQRRDGTFCSCRAERVKEAEEWLAQNDQPQDS